MCLSYHLNDCKMCAFSAELYGKKCAVSSAWYGKKYTLSSEWYGKKCCIICMIQ